MRLIQDYEDLHPSEDEPARFAGNRPNQMEVDCGLDPMIDSDEDSLTTSSYWLVAAILMGAISFIVFWNFAGTNNLPFIVQQPMAVLRGEQVEELQPGATILRNGEAVGTVTEVGCENGVPVAVLDFRPGQQPLADEYCLVAQNSSLFSLEKHVEIIDRNDQWSLNIEHLDVEKFSFGISRLIVGLLAVGTIVGIGLFVLKVIQKSFFWIASAIVLAAVFYYLAQNGISFPEIPTSEFSIPLTLEE